MTITAKLIAHSASPFARMGVRDITTFLERYPRFIHAEVMTHRVFSRNASSSRAIPVKRLIQDVLDDTAMPIHWGRNQPGMQAREEHDQKLFAENPLRWEGKGARPYWHMNTEMTPQEAWLLARDNAIKTAQSFDEAGYHKQIVNRLLEPFAHINVVITATDFDNFFWLRSHPDAQPEIKVLSDLMYSAKKASTPRILKTNEWHLPFVTDEDRNRVELVNGGNGNVIEHPVTQDDLVKVSVARCARTSYMTHDGRTPDFEEDRDLYHRLVGGEPLHASPAEHQAQPQVPSGHYDCPLWDDFLRGNFNPGWTQYRKTLPREHCLNYEEWLETA